MHLSTISAVSVPVGVGVSISVGSGVESRLLKTGVFLLLPDCIELLAYFGQYLRNHGISDYIYVF
jgi:hypothetical protein